MKRTIKSTATLIAMMILIASVFSACGSKSEKSGALLKAADSFNGSMVKVEGDYEYVRYVYQKWGYSVIDTSLVNDKQNSPLSVDVRVPMGEEHHVIKVDNTERTNNDYQGDNWYIQTAYPDYNADAFKGEWYYNGPDTRIKMIIHQIDFEKKKVAYEYDFDFYMFEASGGESYKVKCNSKSDRVLTADLRYTDQKREDRGYFNIEGVNCGVSVNGKSGIAVDGIALTKDNSYKSYIPFLSPVKELFNIYPISCSGDKLLKPYDSVLSCKDGDGTRRAQTYPLYGAYETISGTAFINKENEEDLNKKAEIRIYGDGKLLKTITSSEVIAEGEELFFEVGIKGVKELTIDMPGDAVIRYDAFWGNSSYPFLCLKNMLLSKNDAYKVLMQSESSEGALRFDFNELEAATVSYSFYDKTGWRPIIVTVPYDSQYFELNSDFEYDIKDSTARQYAKSIYDKVAEPGSNSFLLIYFSDGIEKNEYAVDRYFYFYCPKDENVGKKIQSWFLETCQEESNYLSSRVLDTLSKDNVVPAVLGAYYIINP